MLLATILASFAHAEPYSAEKRAQWMDICVFGQPEANCACLLEEFERAIPEAEFLAPRPTTEEIIPMSKRCAEKHPITAAGEAEVRARQEAVGAAAPPPAPFVAPAPRAPRDGPDWVPFNVALAGPVELFPDPDTVGFFSVSLLHNRDHNVGGLQLGGLWQNVTGKLVGFQVAPFNGFEGEVYGAQVGISNVGDFTRNIGTVYGLQASLYSHGGGCYGLCVAATTSAYDVGGGLHVGLIYTSSGAGFRGVQIGASNLVGSKLESYEEVDQPGPFTEIQTTSTVWDGSEGRGMQIGAIANAAKNYRGVQITAAINMTEYQMAGTQIGFFNYAQSMRGVQIGVINVAQKLRGVQIGAFNVAVKNPLPFMVLVNAGF